MARYRFTRDYGSSLGIYFAGDWADFSPETAAWLERDAPGCIESSEAIDQRIEAEIATQVKAEAERIVAEQKAAEKEEADRLAAEEAEREEEAARLAAEEEAKTRALEEAPKDRQVKQATQKRGA